MFGKTEQPSSEHPLLAPVSSETARQRLSERRGGFANKLFGLAMRGLFGQGVVDTVNQDLVTHQVLADQQRAAQQPPLSVQPEFMPPTNVAPGVIGARAPESQAEPAQPLIRNGVIGGRPQQ